MNQLNIWLAYVGLPHTTAVYWERALRKLFNVVTMGPRPSQQLVENWQLKKISHLVKSHDIELGATPDMLEIFKNIPERQKPDIYLWVESAAGYFPKNIDKLPCKTACYLIDTYLSINWHIQWAKQFNFVFLADLGFVDQFRREGINAHWLPLACDEEIHVPPTLEKVYEIGFIGTVYEKSERHQLLIALSKKFSVHHERSFLQEMAKTFSRSKIVFNNAPSKTAMNMRFYEAMASGSLLLSDMSINSGQDQMFEAHFDYALYQPKNLIQVTEYYLEDELARETVAERGKQVALSAHTYLDRVRNCIDVISGKSQTTYSPTEWRNLSDSRIERKVLIEKDKAFSDLISQDSVQRSFIIPVLDYSPASIYNIKTLLEDLSDIGGELIIVFNNEKIASEIKLNPRINHYAILNENIGVPRAWNIGLDICRTEYAFILNSDLHLSKQVIQDLQESLKTLPDAAIVGTQGSYFNFESLQDYLYLDKGKFDTALEVDAVSGFLFGVKTALFHNKTLQFENKYTPCYFEEWDLGLQIRKAGLKSYVIPQKSYEHHWSGSIRSYRQITYYDRAQTSKQIHLRNGYLFQKKWRAIAKQSNKCDLLLSVWIGHLSKLFNIAIANHNLASSKKYLSIMCAQFPQENQTIECIDIFKKTFPLITLEK